MTRPACRTCDHWASQSPKLPQGMGYCRINPPVCVAVDNEVRTVWPIVPGHSRCALYEPAEAYAAALRDREIAERLQAGQRVDEPQSFAEGLQRTSLAHLRFLTGTDK